MDAIKVEGVNKTFKLPHEKQSSVKSIFVSLFKGKRTYEKQQVLKDISFEIKDGEFFGIVGRNGSGKSTLLKLLAGIYAPDSGHIQVNGKLTPFIELGVGFNPELTGRENVFLNGALLGFNRKEMNKLYPEIVEFAELEKFMDQKLKNYSSGMQVRLAFSIAIRARSEILLLDEVLAVGDAVFQKKCYDYFKQLKKDKKTVVFVSHDTNALLEYCNRGILIENGRIVSEGKIDKVVHDYTDILNQREEHENNTSEGKKSRWGNGQAEVSGITLRSNGKTQKIFADKDKTVSIEVEFIARDEIDQPVVGITILDAGGQRVFASNTLWMQVKTPHLKNGQTMRAVWNVPNVFNSGTFTVSPAISDDSGSVTYDWLDEAAQFKVRKQMYSSSYINADHEVTIK